MLLTVGLGGAALGLFHSFLKPHKPVQAFGEGNVVRPFGSTQHMQHFATHSNAAYGDVAANASLMNAGWIRDAELSNANHQTYVKDGKAVLAYRGTKVTNASDLVADAHILTGTEALGSRFREATDVAQRAKAKYGKDNVTLTGHSLGSSQASYASRRTGLQAVSFNPGAGAVGLIDRVMNAITNRNNVTYVVPGDVVSANAGALGGHVYKVPKRVRDPHSIANFLS